MADLYHNRILELAADIPHLGHLDEAHGSATKLARICGSTVRVDVTLSEDGQTVTAIAVDPKACALGQAATAILAEHAVGASVEDIRVARDGLHAMLKDGAEPPRGAFWELRHLEGVRDYPPRHASTMLAFEAVLEAIEAAREALGLEAVAS
ncbi:iron-sulfur cluster assembly scaffold protein [Hyphomonas sp. FCG-A18]|uniref:iron-sulfur cluster assembly scaffold protein n=1 Tax=Hyphomonas sp. FCG-A18 TaxID=3080019 RepID=UPI002B28D32E|nr:iron-sulfur cluster assembly scaffold protein [Hyphomonas sp. FCG-A18]